MTLYKQISKCVCVSVHVMMCEWFVNSFIFIHAAVSLLQLMHFANKMAENMSLHCCHCNVQACSCINTCRQKVYVDTNVYFLNDYTLSEVSQWPWTGEYRIQKLTLWTWMQHYNSFNSDIYKHTYTLFCLEIWKCSNVFVCACVPVITSRVLGRCCYFSTSSLCVFPTKDLSEPLM